MGVGLLFDNFFNLFRRMYSLNQCECGSDTIAIDESHTRGVQNYVIIKCKKCKREVKRRNYNKAVKAWNKNNPRRGAE